MKIDARMQANRPGGKTVAQFTERQGMGSVDVADVLVRIWRGLAPSLINGR